MHALRCALTKMGNQIFQFSSSIFFKETTTDETQMCFWVVCHGAETQREERKKCVEFYGRPYT